MPELDFLSYLKTLSAADWQVMVNNHWTVKDAVAHMVGWEKIDPAIIRKTWQSKKRPWFYETDDFDEFNAKSVAYYQDYTPDQLLVEWEKHRSLSEQEIDRIGEEKLRAHPELFGWLFEEEYKPTSHYNQHYRQIRDALKKRKEV